MNPPKKLYTLLKLVLEPLSERGEESSSTTAAKDGLAARDEINLEPWRLLMKSTMPSKKRLDKG
jgi:hypothetical protein